jgi:hypothetical protein
MAITGDNLLIMPDYKGFGISRELVQPYCNHELCAQNSIDAMKAGYKIFLDTSGAATRLTRLSSSGTPTRARAASRAAARYCSRTS